MANKIGSEFIEDFELEKGNVFSKLRSMMMILGVAIGVIVTTVVILLEMSDAIYYAVDFLVVLPLCFFGLSLDEKMKLKQRWYFLTLETVRVYETELDEE